MCVMWVEDMSGRYMVFILCVVEVLVGRRVMGGWLLSQLLLGPSVCTCAHNNDTSWHTSITLLYY